MSIILNFGSSVMGWTTPGCPYGKAEPIVFLKHATINPKRKTA
jgi:hypothetical protein